MSLIEKIFNWRWKIGGIFFIICVIFEIHGSSIEIYSEIFHHPEFSDILLGKYRFIRSDEWMVFTPFAFSQYFTNFSMISDVVRGTATNMFLTYGQAVWDIAMIYRPAQIGYLFLDAGSGLAFFWAGRQIIILLVSFEFARLILQVNKKLCVLYAIMVGFSPFVQWWYSVAGAAELFFAGQGLVIFWKLYLERAEEKIRFLHGVGFLWCAGIFIFIIYPAWQIVFGYVYLICLIAVSLEKSDTLKILWRDKFFWLIGFAVMIAPILHIVYISQDMIKIQMATEYPGQRFIPGGELQLYYMLVHSICSLLPFKDLQEISNNCEMSTFYSMAPLGLIMSFLVMWQRKIFDKLTILAMALPFALIFFQVAGLPNWLAKITLLSNVLEVRARPATDFLQLILLFRSLKFIQEFPSKFKSLILAELIAVASAFAVYKFLPDWFRFGRAFYSMAFLTVSAFLFLMPMNKKRAAILAVMMLSMGVTVNPINSGVDVVYKLPIGQKISEIVQQEISSGQPKSLWITESHGLIKNVPIMFGAPTINSINVYPALERWKKLDPEGKNFKIYNRYAHIAIKLQDKPTEFEFIALDQFRIKLNVSDLPKLNVGYILSSNGGLQNLSKPNIEIVRIYNDAGIFIYKINYL